ncbi:hypothetical protein RN001_012812 [Aquatica leii]|uniref:MPN domain-containing protein n=1 Tax=Aquatica leii TaxID=1421715 RepID=A0AAN7SPN1_9COLE|nr:hypothetical protein RN001_012812 [Aquatica leii]
MSENHIPYLRNVYLSADVYAICLQHALTTEKEEVMGLLIGEVDQENAASHITACIILHRSDKQPDRVEISPEQLCEASIYADELAQKLNKPMRVLGWYHSHPHITVCPSHVDLGTQSTYQILDPLFVGLIFSVYGTESRTISSKVEVTCFQARGTANDLHRREIQLTIKPSQIQSHNLKALTDLPNILMKEVSDHFSEINDSEDELARLHNNALKTLQLTEITSKITLPMCDFLEMRLNSITTRMKELELLRESLKTEVELMNK